MKSRICRTGEGESRWEWEKTKKVIVFTLTNKFDVQKLYVIKFIRELLEEFAIPLNVIDGNDYEYNKELPILKEVLFRVMNDNIIDYEKFEDEIKKVRNLGKLPYGIVILIDKNRYKFISKPSIQPPIYGIGIDDGLVILRYTHRESARHEFAHMLGLIHHKTPKKECIMNWECATSKFCNKCRKEIQEIWEEEIGEES